MPEPEIAVPATLEDWLSHLEQGHDVAIDLGLERVSAVWAALGAPRPGLRVVTVAGTNGKGSTVHALEALARAHGKRVAATTSPHLQRFNERIRIDGIAVDDRTIVSAFERIDAARREAGVSLTYFETAILAALLTMADAAPDLAVLEVGLGGRLDAVNIIDADLMVITPIALDHQAWLGDDREAIGAEKAGILRAGRPCVVTDPAPPDSVLDRAAALGAPVLRIGEAFGIENEGYRGPDGTRIEGIVNDQVHPGALAGALAAYGALGLDLDAERAQEAASTVSIPGRMQRVESMGRSYLLDVAHNPHAAGLLAERIAELGPVHLVFGAFADKDVAGMLRPMEKQIAGITLVPTPGARGASVDALADAALELSLPDVTTADDVASGVRSASRRAGAGEWILVCGSFTVVGAALTALGEEVT